MILWAATSLETVPSLILQNVCIFESNPTSDWLNQMVE